MKKLIIKKRLKKGKYCPAEWNPFVGLYPQIFELLVFFEEENRELATKLFPNDDARKIWQNILHLATVDGNSWPIGLTDVKKIILGESHIIEDFFLREGNRTIAYQSMYYIWYETRKVRVVQSADDYDRYIDKIFNVEKKLMLKN